MQSSENGSYDIALICNNGHVINHSLTSRPEISSAFCAKCGAATISKCPNCQTEIRGKYNHPYVKPLSYSMVAPKYCHNCGKPYPWTQSSLQAAHEFFQEIAGLSDDEKNILDNSLDDLVKDIPQSSVAASRFKRILAKTGKETADIVKSIVIEIISETAKKAIWP